MRNKALMLITILGVAFIGCSSNNVEIEKVEDSYTTVAKESQPLDDFFKAYINRGNIDEIDNLAREFNVYSSKNNSGSNVYYIIALSKDESKETDLTKCDYCIVINETGSSLSYYNNIDFIEILYSKENGFAVIDLYKRMPFEDGTFQKAFSNVDDALAYHTETENGYSSLEQLYMDAEIGMPKDEFEKLVSQYGLELNYRRSNSNDGYIGIKPDYGNGIKFDLSDTLVDLDYYDYYVYRKYGVHVEYVSEIETTIGTSQFPGTGYYIVGNDDLEKYNSATDAINALQEYRQE